MSEATEEHPRRTASVARPARRRWIRWGLLAALVAAGGWIWVLASRPSVPDGAVLYLDWSRAPPERSRSDLLQLVEEPPADIFDLTRGLRLAAQDPAVTGVMVRLGAGQLSAGKADELRGLLKRLRDSGKPVLAFVSAPDTWSYHVASVADRLLLDQSTTFDAVGLRLHAFFLRDALRRFGIELDLLRTGDFKGAFEELALAAPTPEFEETANAIVESLSQSVIEGIAAARGLDPQTVRALFDQAPLSADEAVRERLVDGAASMDEALAWWHERLGRRPELLSSEEYLAIRGDGAQAGRRFAVIHVLGVILEGESRPFLLGGQAAGVDTIARHLRAAVADPGIAGIVLRIDSPGGSVAAAEALHDAVALARKSKPLVASCGGTAASGGYYAACAAERIVSQPTTLTGSIGVFGGKVVLEGLLQSHQVESRVYARGKRARMADPTRRYTPEERLALKGLLDDAYRSFVSRVAVGRRKGFEEIHAVAQGRVWTGARALQLGLVDGLGGLEEAATLLRELAHVPTEEAVELSLWPPRESLWSFLAGGSSRPVPPQPLGTVLGREGGAALPFEQLESMLEDLGLWRGAGRLALLSCWLQVR